MARSDGDELLSLLTDDFVGTVSDGMPHGVGGRHVGALNMVASVWAHIDTIYDVRVDASEYLAVDDHTVVVLGRYRGSARDHGSSVDAAFAHIITTRGDRVATLRQITDTAQWRRPYL